MTLYLSISTMCLSSNLALALVASSLVPLARAQTSVGSDAPGAPPPNPGNPAAENAAGASGAGNGGLSKQNQIIVGVVVGVAALVAIAGGVYYFVKKKREWDERKKRYEAIQNHRSEGSRRQHEMSLRQQSRRRGRDVEQGKGTEITTVPKDEPRNSRYPKYDPSSFHHHHQNSSVDSSHAMTSFDLPRQSYTHQRTSSQFSAVMPPPPAPAQATSNWDSVADSPNQDDSSPSDTNSPTPMVKAPSSRWRGSLRAPQKPKPVLTKLITNL